MICDGGGWESIDNVHLFLYYMCCTHGECVYMYMYECKATTVLYIGCATNNVLYVVSFPDPGGWDWGLGMRLTLLRVRFGMLYVESKKWFCCTCTSFMPMDMYFGNNTHVY